MKTTSTFLFIFITSYLFAQLPNTDIWILDIVDSAGRVSLRNPINLTNRTGYDNQPAFSPDGSYLLYTSQPTGETQTDIYRCDFKTKTTSQITKTTTSEYSPTFMSDKKSFSVVMVEKDSAQRLWKYPLTGGEAVCIAKNISAVGYHSWMNKDSLAVFVLTKPSFTLQLFNIASQKPTTIADSIGRCMRMKDGLLWYTTKAGHFQNVYSYSFNSKKDSLQGVIESEDYAFYKRKTGVVGREEIWSFSDSSILYGFMSTSGGAHEVSDLSVYGITKPTRITISPDGKKLAIVSNK